MNGVALGYVHGGVVHEPFFRSVVDAVLWDRPRMGLIRKFESCGGLYVAINRNKVVEKFLETDCEWLWFLDTDIVFGHETLYQLLKLASDHDIKIISALYFGRLNGNDVGTQPIWMVKSPDGVYQTLAEFNHGLNEVDAIGMGCCLIHREVLEKMRDVYDDDEWMWFSHDVVTKVDGTKTHLGEDLTFCRRAQALGYRIFGSGSVVVGHVKSRIENLDTFIANLNVQFERLDAAGRTHINPDSNRGAALPDPADSNGRHDQADNLRLGRGGGHSLDH